MKKKFSETWVKCPAEIGGLGFKLNIFIKRLGKHSQNSKFVNSVTRLGNFWKFLVTDFFQKQPKCRVFFENITFLGEAAVATFWATLGKFGLLFTSISGHTVNKSNRIR